MQPTGAKVQDKAYNSNLLVLYSHGNVTEALFLFS
jgi:hypothetical protein